MTVEVITDSFGMMDSVPSKPRITTYRAVSRVTSPYRPSMVTRSPSLIDRSSRMAKPLM